MLIIIATNKHSEPAMVLWFLSTNRDRRERDPIIQLFSHHENDRILSFPRCIQIIDLKKVTNIGYKPIKVHVESFVLKLNALGIHIFICTECNIVSTMILISVTKKNLLPVGMI